MVAEDLPFDVARAAQIFLDVEAAVTERRFGLARDDANSRGEVFFVFDQAHALAAATGRRLQHDREADFFGNGADLRLGFERSGRAGNDRNARLGHEFARLDLVAHFLDCGCGRADENEAGVPDRAGEAGIFGEKAVAGMDRLGAGLSGGFDDARGIEVTFGGWRRSDLDGVVGLADVKRGAVGVGDDGGGLDTQLAARADDTDGDFAAVGGEDSLKHQWSWMVWACMDRSWKAW